MRANHKLLVLNTIKDDVVVSLYVNIKFLKNYTSIELLDNNVFRIENKISDTRMTGPKWKHETVTGLSDIERTMLDKAMTAITNMINDENFEIKAGAKILDLFKAFCFMSLNKDMMMPVDSSLPCYVKDIDINSTDDNFVDECTELFVDINKLVLFARDKEAELEARFLNKKDFVSMEGRKGINTTIIAVTRPSSGYVATTVFRTLRTSAGFVPIDSDCVHIVLNEPNSEGCVVKCYQMPYSEIVSGEDAAEGTNKFISMVLKTMNSKEVYSTTSDSDKIIYASFLNIMGKSEFKFTGFKIAKDIPEVLFDFDAVAEGSTPEIQSAILDIQSNAKTMYMIDMQIKFEEMEKMADTIMSSFGGLMKDEDDSKPLC